MMTDKLIAFVCIAALFLFLGVDVVFVKEFDLFVILSIAFSLACLDFWLTLYRPNNGKNGNS
jgi:hypothetical protein